jgi:hypothetical protein
MVALWLVQGFAFFSLLKFRSPSLQFRLLPRDIG